MRGEIITYTNGSDKLEAYLSPSVNGKGPGIIVLQEWWGLVDHIKDVADRFAAAGFTALAPDLFHGKSTKDPDEATTLMQALHIADTEAILRKAILTLMTHPAVSSHEVGVVGFCMGGQLALFAAGSNPVIKACVDFYGIHPKVVPSYRTINGPILGHFAEHDDYASPAAVKALGAELTLLGKEYEFHTYPGTHHAFFNDTRPEVYDAEASNLAWQRTVEFFHAQLG